MKRSAAVFLFGAIVTWVLMSFVFTQKPAGELRSKGPDAKVLGVRHTYGDSARAAALIAGIKIPDESIDCFYSIGGLNPVIEFVAFTLPKDKLWQEVTALTGKTNAAAHVPLLLQGPELFGEESRTILYDPTKISTPLALDWKLKKNLPAECIVDELTGRVFILVSK